MRAYAPDYSQAALDALLSSSFRRRARAQIAIAQLCRGIPRDGDYRERDQDGRTWEVRLIDSVVFTYWIDHAACEVRIGLIEWIE